MNDRNSGFTWAPAARARRCIRIGGLGALVLALAACGGDGKTGGPGQVMARVNSAEITVHQMNNELARLGMQGVSRDDRTAKRVLDGLVDQQLLVQEAIEARLDRDPQVLQVIEQARRQILSEAFLERNVTVPRPGPDEVKSFYTEHPALFQKRRIYSFRDYVIERSQFSDALRGKLDAAKTRADVAATLKAANVDFREAASVRGAEQLPLDILPSVMAMAKGDISALINDNTVVLLQLTDSTEQPVALEQATAYIEQYLVNARRKQLAESKLMDLRATAKIAYLAPAENSQEERKPEVRPQPAATRAGDTPRSIAGMGEAWIKKGLQSLTGK